MQATGGITRVPRTLGILSIVFGSIILFFSFFGLLGLLVPLLASHAPPSSRPEDAVMLTAISRIYGSMGGISALLSVMSALLLGLGIGQIRYRRWAAAWSVRWAVVALGAVVVMALVTATFFSSFLDLIGSVPGSNPNAAAGARQAGWAIGVVYGFMTVLFYAPYPLVLLVFFSRRDVRTAMTA
jgi:hypothetical protein